MLSARGAGAEVRIIPLTRRYADCPRSGSICMPIRRSRVTAARAVWGNQPKVSHMADRETTPCEVNISDSRACTPCRAGCSMTGADTAGVFRALELSMNWPRKRTQLAILVAFTVPECWRNSIVPWRWKDIRLTLKYRLPIILAISLMVVARMSRPKEMPANVLQ